MTIDPRAFSLTASARLLLLAGMIGTVVGCSRSPAAPPGNAAQAGTTPAAASAQTGQAATLPPGPAKDEPLPPVPSPYDALPEEARRILDLPSTGDLDEMVKRRLIRAGVVFNRTQYYIDKGVQRGFVYEAISLLEKELNQRLKTGNLGVHVAFVPLTRDQLFPALEAGKVDFVAAALTITPARQQVAAFSTPTRTNVSEIVVTGPGVAPVAKPDDLSGREVFVRRSSSYYESLTRLNERLTIAGRLPVAIKDAPEPLEDDDLLEMVNAGLIDATVVDDYLVEFWRQVFPDLHVNPAAVHTGGEIAVGVRKTNPKLLRAVNLWIKEYGPRTAFGNTMERRYLQSATYVKNATADAERRKFTGIVKLFDTYASKYNVDYLMVAAQGYQESRLDQSVKSPVGAIGIMQVMPATGKELNVGDITQLEPNVHAGVKYFRFMMDQYFKDEPMTELDKGLMTFASYNAGPNRIRQLRKEAAARGLNPHVWFGNVERIASERIGRETVTYVSNIFKYYIAYKLTQDRAAARDRAKTLSQGTP